MVPFFAFLFGDVDVDETSNFLLAHAFAVVVDSIFVDDFPVLLLKNDLMLGTT